MNTQLYIGQPIKNMYDNYGYIYDIQDDNRGMFLIGAGLEPITKRCKVVYVDRPALTEISEQEAVRWSGWAGNIEPLTDTDQLAQLVEQAKQFTEQAKKERDQEAEIQAAISKAYKDQIKDKVPAWAKAVIIAEYHEDQSDPMTDYFGYKTTEYIILGFSKHTRDIFSELRKAAANAPETAHLAIKPEKPESADEYWTPKDEHREKYSMGGGYYLGAYRNSTGWVVRKQKFYSDPLSSIPQGRWAIEPPKQEKPETMTNGTVFAHLEQHEHTKKGFTMYMVILDSDLERDQFNDLRDQAVSMGGWYSRKWGKTPGGFAFKELALAEQFLNAISGELPTDEPPKPTKKQGDKLRTMADKLQPQIDNKLADRLTNTPKRLAQANHSRLDGERLQRTQQTLYKLADLYDSGDVPALLRGFTTKASVYDVMDTKKEMVPNGYHSYSACTGKPSDTSPEAVALWALLDGKTDEQKKADELRRKIEGLQFSNIPGYFPTPDHIIDRMIQYADISDDDLPCEPSAGDGRIADKIKKLGRSPICLEINYTLRSIIEAKGHHLAGDDFMQFDPVTLPTKYIMNPPFEKGQDIAHIMHAYDLLPEGGKVVAICANGSRQNEQLQPIANYWEVLPAGTFKQAGTNITTVLLVITK